MKSVEIRNVLRLLAVLLAWVAVGISSSGQDATSASIEPTVGATEACVRIDGPSDLAGPTSGVWQNGNLLVADVAEQALFSHNVELPRASLEPLNLPEISSEPLSGPLRRFQGSSAFGDAKIFQSLDLSVIRVLPDDAGYLVEDEGGQNGDRLLRLNEAMEVTGVIKIASRPLAEGWTLDVIYDWQPTYVRGKDIGLLAFGDFYKEDSWSSGLVHFDTRGRSEIILSMDTNSEVSYQHAKELDYLAVVDDFGYMLVFEPEPYLLKVSLNLGKARSSVSERLEIPSDFQSRPAVRSSERWKSASWGAEKWLAYLEVLEEAHSMPTSLVARAGQLYMTGRSHEKDGSVAWSLVELNSNSGAEISRARLPVHEKAYYLTLAAGDNIFAFLERGAVERIGDKSFEGLYRRIGEITVVPAQWLDNLADGRLDSASTSTCL